jgi:predicted esterase YcpF (UPF0227 family)
MGEMNDDALLVAELARVKQLETLRKEKQAAEMVLWEVDNLKRDDARLYYRRAECFFLAPRTFVVDATKHRIEVIDKQFSDIS